MPTTISTKNPSVEEFKRQLAEIAPSIQAEALTEVDKQANRLVDLMRTAVPVKSGKLRQSIRVEPGPNKVSRRVVAGGKLTTVEVRSGSGVAYDYARAVEFGTVNERAQSFFWPSYRLMKRSIKSALSRASKRGIDKIMKLTETP